MSVSCILVHKANQWKHLLKWRKYVLSSTDINACELSNLFKSKDNLKIIVSFYIMNFGKHKIKNMPYIFATDFIEEE